MTSDQIQKLTSIIPPSQVLTEPAQVERLSKDFYWYSPILKPQLENKRADVIVQPTSLEEAIATIRFAFAENIPVTVRGAGTGNYGQAIPLQGGIVLDSANFNKIHSIQNGIIECDPGVRLGTIEGEARKIGWELRCYPSTWVKASVGGFIGGGSGGVGSILHGGLAEPGTVAAIDVLTMEAEPRVIHHEGQSVHDVRHSWGTNGIIVKVWLGLAPKQSWAQLCAVFDTWDACYDFSEKIAFDDTWVKRLATSFEWPIPSYFAPIRKYLPDGKSAVFFEIEDSQAEHLKTAAEAAGGTVTYLQNYSEPRKGPLLSDYVYNHTTLWAIKADNALTYLQCGFETDRVREQFALLKARFGDDFLFHLEFAKGGGKVGVGAIPIIRYSTDERLWEMVHYCEEIGVGVANPHLNFVEGGGRYRPDNIQLLTKHKYDKRGLLNPGKMKSFTPNPDDLATL